MVRVVRVCGAAVAAFALAVPAGDAADSPKTGEGSNTKRVVTCARMAFAARIVRVGTDAVAVAPGASHDGRARVVALADETVVRQGDTVVERSALAAGKRARFLVRACGTERGRTMTARAIVLADESVAASGEAKTPPDGTAPKPEPKPAAEVCGQGETNTALVAVSPSEITVRTSSSEGTKEWTLTVNGDTVVRKNDQDVAISDLKAGDLVHVVLVRCPSGSVRALRVVLLPAPPATTAATAPGA